MNVLVAGATGAIGRHLVPALIAAGHDVIGLTSSQEGVNRLTNAGAKGLLVDVLDANAVTAAVAGTRIDAAIEELTSLPKRYTPEDMRASAERDRTVRLEGGRNVQNAATAAGARRYIVQSTGFFYSSAPGTATERDGFATIASPAVSASVRTYTKIEDRVLGSSKLDGVALRYGFFYGPGTWFAEDGDIANQVRERKYPVIGSGQGVFSFVHVEDAAAATLAALECSPGIYNIVDDNPTEMAVWLPAFAAFLGAPAPPFINEAEALRTAGSDAVYYATRLRGASNAKARGALNFAPRPLEWLRRSGADAETRLQTGLAAAV